MNVTEARLDQATQPDSQLACTMQTDLLARDSQVKDSSRAGKLDSENKDSLNKMNSLNILGGLTENNRTVCDIPTKICSCTMINKDYCQICKLENAICS